MPLFTLPPLERELRSVASAMPTGVEGTDRANNAVGKAGKAAARGVAFYCPSDVSGFQRSGDVGRGYQQVFALLGIADLLSF